MARTWEQEKAYCAKRAGELKEAMIEATIACDVEEFEKLRMKAMRYMTRKELGRCVKMFWTHYEN